MRITGGVRVGALFPQQLNMKISRHGGVSKRYYIESDRFRCSEAIIYPGIQRLVVYLPLKVYVRQMSTCSTMKCVVLLLGNADRGPPIQYLCVLGAVGEY